MKCQVCGAVAEILFADCDHKENFCPNCGADLAKPLMFKKTYFELQDFKIKVKGMTREEKQKMLEQISKKVVVLS